MEDFEIREEVSSAEDSETYQEARKIPTLQSVSVSTVPYNQQKEAADLDKLMETIVDGDDMLKVLGTKIRTLMFSQPSFNAFIQHGGLRSVIASQSEDEAKHKLLTLADELENIARKNVARETIEAQDTNIKKRPRANMKKPPTSVLSPDNFQGEYYNNKHIVDTQISLSKKMPNSTVAQISLRPVFLNSVMSKISQSVQSSPTSYLFDTKRYSKPNLHKAHFALKEKERIYNIHASYKAEQVNKQSKSHDSNHIPSHAKYDLENPSESLPHMAQESLPHSKYTLPTNSYSVKSNVAQVKDSQQSRSKKSSYNRAL